MNTQIICDPIVVAAAEAQRKTGIARDWGRDPGYGLRPFRDDETHPKRRHRPITRL